MRSTETIAATGQVPGGIGIDLSLSVRIIKLSSFAIDKGGLGLTRANLASSKKSATIFGSSIVLVIIITAGFQSFT